MVGGGEGSEMNWNGVVLVMGGRGKSVCETVEVGKRKLGRYGERDNMSFYVNILKRQARLVDCSILLIICEAH